MATFLCVLTADGSYFVCMNIHEYPRKQFRPCLLAEVRQLCLLVDVCGGAVLFCVCAEPLSGQVSSVELQIQSLLLILLSTSLLIVIASSLLFQYDTVVQV